MDELGHHFSVSIGGEFVTLGSELVAQGLKILNNAVMDYSNALGGVGMGVALAGHAMSRPAGMANAECTSYWPLN